MSLLMLKDRVNMRYRDFIDFVFICPDFMKILKLSKIPHYTTLQKFFNRINSATFDRLLSISVRLFDICDPWIAIDATGHSSDYASKHYEKRIKRKRKNYSKNSIAVDTKTQAILAQKARKGPRHDSIDADALIRKCKYLKPEGFSLDKGYDCERIHKVIREELGAQSQIPVRLGLTKNGKYRKELIFGVDKEKYHKRNIAETVNSVMKKVFGEENRARSERMRNKETKIRNLCYNVYRRVVVLSNDLAIIFEGFYKAIQGN
jgi:transposase